MLIPPDSVAGFGKQLFPAKSVTARKVMRIALVLVIRFRKRISEPRQSGSAQKVSLRGLIALYHTFSDLGKIILRKPGGAGGRKQEAGAGGRSRRQEAGAGGRKQEAGGRRQEQEAGSRKQEAGGRRQEQEAGGRKQEAGSRRRVSTTTR
jgi:hypothetical protein